MNLNPRTPGAQGPTFTGAPRVPAGQTFTAVARDRATYTRLAPSEAEARSEGRQAPQARRATSRIGLLALAILVPLVYLGFTKSIPFRQHYEIKAVFESSNNIKKASPVRIAGVEVGRVTKVERVKKGGEAVVVTMRIGKAGRPIHDDARAKIRPRIFLEGNFFVDIEPGTPGARRRSRTARRSRSTRPRSPVQLDQLLTVAAVRHARGPQDAARRVRQRARQGRRRGVQPLDPVLEAAPTATRRSSTRRRSGEAEHDLSGYIKSAGATAAALDRNAGQLKSLITDFNTTAGAFAREDDNLRSAIAELPRTLRAAQPALAALNASFPPLRALRAGPAARACSPPGPALDASIPLVRELRGLVSEDELRGLAADLRPTVPALARLARESIPLSEQGRLLASCQNEVVLPVDARTRSATRSSRPTARSTRRRRRRSPGLAGESRSGDANGQWFRVLAAGGTNLVTLAPGVFGTTTQPDPRRQPAQAEGAPAAGRDASRARPRSRPDLRSQPGAPPEQHQVDTSTDAVQGALRAGPRPRRRVADEAAQGRGPRQSKLKIGDKDATKALLDVDRRGRGKP